jgi:hypothetical protein
MIKKYQLINYFDVWGNEKDGFEVNNLCVEEKDLMIEENSTDKEIFQFLKLIGFIKKTVRLNQLNIDKNFCDSILCEIEERKTGRPICRIEEMR